MLRVWGGERGAASCAATQTGWHATSEESAKQREEVASSGQPATLSRRRPGVDSERTGPPEGGPARATRPARAVRMLHSFLSRSGDWKDNRTSSFIFLFLHYPKQINITFIIFFSASQALVE